MQITFFVIPCSFVTLWFCTDSLFEASVFPWTHLISFSFVDEGLQWLSQEFGLCGPLKSQEDVFGFKGWLQETWVNLAMVDYPYEANFLQPLPAWPVKVR